MTRRVCKLQHQSNCQHCGPFLPADLEFAYPCLYIASDFLARTEVTNNLPVVDTLPVVSFSVLDQTTNYLPPYNKVERAKKKLVAKFIKDPTILSSRQKNYIVNEVVKQIGQQVKNNISNTDRDPFHASRPVDGPGQTRFVGRSMGFIFVAQDRTMHFVWIIDSTFHNVQYNSIITHCKYLLINQE